MTFYKSYQYQRHYLAVHDTRTDQEVEDELGKEKKPKGVKYVKKDKAHLPDGTWCEEC